MAIENAKKFVDMVQNDAALAERVKNMAPQEGLALAKEMGLEFTIEELKQAEEGAENRELSLDEMGKGVGGLAPLPFPQDRRGNKASADKASADKDLTCPKSADGNHHFVYEGHYEGHSLFGLHSQGYDRYVCTFCGCHDDRKV